MAELSHNFLESVQNNGKSAHKSFLWDQLKFIILEDYILNLHSSEGHMCGHTNDAVYKVCILWAINFSFIQTAVVIVAGYHFSLVSKKIYFHFRFMSRRF